MVIQTFQLYRESRLVEGQQQLTCAKTVLSMRFYDTNSHVIRMRAIYMYKLHNS